MALLCSPRAVAKTQSSAVRVADDVQQPGEVFDVIVVDFPDPTNFAIGKLYTSSFYALLDRRLAASGYAVVQTTSPLVLSKSSGPWPPPSSRSA